MHRQTRVATRLLSCLSAFFAFSMLVSAHAYAARARVTISGSPPLSVQSAKTYRFQPTTSASSTRLYYWIRNKPNWATFDNKSGLLTGTAGAAGDYSGISITVTDGRSWASLPRFTIHVTAASTPPATNHAPTISGSPATTAQVGKTYTFAPTAADADHDALSFSIQNKPAWANFSIATGQLSGTPTSAGSAANIGITVSDGKTSAALAPFTLTITAPTSTADTQLPSVPAGVVATASGSSQVNVSWSASTDNVGVTGYRVMRCSGASCTPSTQVATPTGTSFGDAGLQAGTTYRYQVAARDAAGNVSASSAAVGATTAASGPVGTSDFATRCAAAGVIKCVGFDNASDISGTYGDRSGILPGKVAPQLDTGTRASGNSSLKFTIPSNSGAGDSGSYFTNFSDDLSLQFGENQVFYVQWRQRFSAEFLATNFAGGGGWKQAILGTGDKPGCSRSTSANGSCYASCSTLETVTQNTYQRGFPQMYNSCTGSTSHGPYMPFEQPFNGTDFKLQNARPLPYCLYSQGATKSYFPPNGNCFGYSADEWMTFQVMVRTGPRVNDEFTNSYVSLWVAREGKPSEPVMEWGPYNLSAGSSSEDQKYGKVWLLPYHTGKDASQTHPVGYVWYDELIISRNRIADPSTSTSTSSGGSGTVSDTTRPTVPAALSAAPSGTSQVKLNWSASSDNVGVTGYRVRRNGSHVGTASGISYTDSGLTADTAYSYTVEATDAAGNVSQESNTANVTTDAPAEPPPSTPPPSSPPPASGGSLASLASSLSVGSWVELTGTTAFNGGAALYPPAGGSLLEYTNRGSWNPVNGTVMILGGSHRTSQTSCAETKFVKFTISSNTWTNTLPNPCPTFDNAFIGGIGHSYNHDTVDPATGDFYHRQYGSGKVMVFRQSTQAWAKLPSVPAGAFQVAGALEFFPDRNSLLFLDGDWGLWEYSLASSSWTQRASTNGGGMSPKLAVGPYHNLSVYSSSCHCVLFGGGNGSRAVYKYDSSGAITRMADSPIDFSIPQGTPSGSIVTADPVSGRVLAWTSGGVGYEFNPATNTWRTTGKTTPFTPTSTGGISDAVAIPIKDYGVIMFVRADGGTGRIYLYKHNAN